MFRDVFSDLPAASHGNLPKDHQGLRKFLDDIMAISKSTSFLRSWYAWFRIINQYHGQTHRTWHENRRLFFLEGEVWTIQPPEVGGLHPKDISYVSCLSFFRFSAVFLCGWTRNIRLLIQDSVFLALKILETTFYKEILLLEEIGSSPVEVGSLSHYLQGFIHRWWLALGFLKHLQGRWWFLESW